MQGYIGYTRVSTVQQGTKGVSLQEQRDGIVRYAERNHFPITTWLEEMETAAKRGRPIFNQAMKLLRHGKAKGIILHKLDRGARNLKDWAEIGELSDQGVEIHFVNESLDLQSRGGRLSADIQAVVAADYIRNLREESRKGFYGRLKQGLYPLPAPLGYLNQGRGKVKTIDPIRGPLILTAFELYATARYDLIGLSDELYRRGLRSRNDRKVNRSALSFLLNNPFYIGLMRIGKTGETFPGIHEPLIRKALFDRVRDVLTGKTNVRVQRHAFMFRRYLTCATCRYSLVGELQKGHVYYRCHTKECFGNSVREDVVHAKFAEFLQTLEFNEKERTYFRAWIARSRDTWESRRESGIKSLNMTLGQLKDRLNRLTDAYIDNALDKTMFEERKRGLLLDRKSVEDNLTNLTQEKRPLADKLENFLELADTAWLSYQLASPEEKRDMVRILTSNRTVQEKKLDLEPSIAFREISNRSKNTDGCPYRAVPRTFDRILKHLTTLNTNGQLPDLDPIMGCSDKDTERDVLEKECNFASQYKNLRNQHRY